MIGRVAAKGSSRAGGREPADAGAVRGVYRIFIAAYVARPFAPDRPGPSRMPMPRPVDIMIAGAQRSGTTALKRHLAEHPAVATHHQLELSHFYADEEYERGWDAGFRRYFGHLSPLADSTRLLGKHAHLITSGEALRRLRRHNPEVRIVVSLREPVSRAYSSYRWQRAHAADPGNFEAFVRRWSRETDPEPADRWRQDIYLELSRYVEQMEVVFDVFGRERVRVQILEEYREAPVTHYVELLDWLELPGGFRPDFDARHNPAAPPRSPLIARLIAVLRSERNPIKRAVRKLLPPGAGSRLTRWVRSRNRSSGGGYPPLSPRAREILREHFEPYNRRLERLLGRSLDVWRA